MAKLVYLIILDNDLRKKPFLIKEGDTFAFRIENENLDLEDHFGNINEEINNINSE